MIEGGGWISLRLTYLCIYTLIFHRSMKGCRRAVFTNEGLNETSHLQHITTFSINTVDTREYRHVCICEQNLFSIDLYGK